MHVIGIYMEAFLVFPGNVTLRQGLGAEGDGAEDRALWDTESEGHFNRFGDEDVPTLSPVSEVGLERIKGFTIDT